MSNGSLDKAPRGARGRGRALLRIVGLHYGINLPGANAIRGVGRRDRR